MNLHKKIKPILPNLLYFIVMVCSSYSLKSQTFDKEALFGNPKFEVCRTSITITDKSNINPGSFYIEVALLQTLKNSFYKLNNKTVWQLLNDSTTDWATNLLLFEKYKKDAYLYFAKIKTREKWLPQKQSDTKYWKKELKID